MFFIILAKSQSSVHLQDFRDFQCSKHLSLPPSVFSKPNSLTLNLQYQQSSYYGTVSMESIPRDLLSHSEPAVRCEDLLCDTYGLLLHGVVTPCSIYWGFGAVVDDITHHIERPSQRL